MNTGITKIKQNNLRPRSFFEMEMPPWRRRQSFRFKLVITLEFFSKSITKLGVLVCLIDQIQLKELSLQDVIR